MTKLKDYFNRIGYAFFSPIANYFYRVNERQTVLNFFDSIVEFFYDENWYWEAKEEKERQEQERQKQTDVI
jgi:hypothetical protein